MNNGCHCSHIAACWGCNQRHLLVWWHLGITLKLLIWSGIGGELKGPSTRPCSHSSAKYLGTMSGCPLAERMLHVFEISFISQCSYWKLTLKLPLCAPQYILKKLLSGCRHRAQLHQRQQSGVTMPQGRAAGFGECILPWLTDL